MILYHVSYIDGRSKSTNGKGVKKFFTDLKEVRYFIKKHVKAYYPNEEINHVASLYRVIKIDTEKCARYEQLFPTCSKNDLGVAKSKSTVSDV